MCSMHCRYYVRLACRRCEMCTGQVSHLFLNLLNKISQVYEIEHWSDSKCAEVFLRCNSLENDVSVLVLAWYKNIGMKLMTGKKCLSVKSFAWQSQQPKVFFFYLSMKKRHYSSRKNTYVIMVTYFYITNINFQHMLSKATFSKVI